MLTRPTVKGEPKLPQLAGKGESRGLKRSNSKSHAAPQLSNSLGCLFFFFLSQGAACTVRLQRAFGVLSSETLEK